MLYSLGRKHYTLPLFLAVFASIFLPLLTFVSAVSFNGRAGAVYESGLTTSYLTDLTNWYRGMNGKPLVHYDSRLSQIAQARAEHMALNHYFGHTFNGASHLQNEEAKRLGYTSNSWYFGENLYMSGTYIPPAIGPEDDSEAVTDAWMNSPGHRANILLDGYTAVGFGWVMNSGLDGLSNYVVAVYGDDSLRVADSPEPVAVGLLDSLPYNTPPPAPQQEPAPQTNEPEPAPAAQSQSVPEPPVVQPIESAPEPQPVPVASDPPVVSSRENLGSQQAAIVPWETGLQRAPSEASPVINELAASRSAVTEAAPQVQEQTNASAPQPLQPVTENPMPAVPAAQQSPTTPSTQPVSRNPVRQLPNTGVGSVVGIFLVSLTLSYAIIMLMQAGHNPRFMNALSIIIG